MQSLYVQVEEEAHFVTNVIQSEFLAIMDIPWQNSPQASRCILDESNTGINLLAAPLIPRRDTTFETK